MEIVLTAALDQSNIVFTVIIACIFFLGIILAILKKMMRVREFLPSLSVSIGIFGTFWGIFLGLANFDSSNIAESVPALLDGMKTAFYTSLLGMSISLVLKFFYNIIDDITSKSSTNIEVCLQNIEFYSKETNQLILQLNETIGRCFHSDEEYSLVSQVKLIRQELIDGRRETKNAFSQFTEQFSKMASESLVAELKGVVDKFNAMLNDLVSQSFQDLKDSTIRLNTWQAEYKETITKNHENLCAVLKKIDSLNSIFFSAVQNVQTLSQNMKAIETSLKSISLSGEELSAHSSNLTEQNAILKTSILEIKDAGQKASLVVPEISKRMNEIISQIEELQKNATLFVQQTTSKLQSHVTELSKSSQNQISAIEKSLETELRKSLETFAGAMVSLSNKFVSDYLPLTERLQEILQIAARVKHV